MSAEIYLQGATVTRLTLSETKKSCVSTAPPPLDDDNDEPFEEQQKKNQTVSSGVSTSTVELIYCSSKAQYGKDKAIRGGKRKKIFECRIDLH